MNNLRAIKNAAAGAALSTAAVGMSPPDSFFGRWLERLTPKYWVKRHYGLQVAQEANRLLPRPFYPATTMFELRCAAAPNATGTGAISAKGKSDTSSSGFNDLVSQALRESRMAAVAAGAVGLATGTDFVQGFAAVDDQVLHAASDLFNQRIESIGDLAHRLDGATLGVRLTSALKGRMAEHVLVDHLRSLGADVALAASPNQMGWDLTIDGVAVNPKLYAEAAQTAQHFARFSNVPVVLPADSLHIPADALHFNSLTGSGLETLHETLAQGSDHLTLVDDALSHADLGHQASDALLASGYPATLVHAHLPWAALVLSGWREARLLSAGHTGLTSSIKNVSLDAAGTGIGGFAGAKGGALIGSLFGPVGTGIGAVLGGIGGAIFGRKVTGRIKETPLRDAQANYAAAYAAFQSALGAENQGIEKYVQEVKIREAETLAAAAVSARKQIDPALDAHRRKQKAAWVLEADEARGLLLASLNRVLAFRGNLIARRACCSIWRRWLWPDLSLLACEQAIEVIDTAVRRVNTWQEAVAVGDRLNRSEVYSFLGAIGFAEAEIRESLMRLEQEQCSREESIHRMVRDAMAILLSLRQAAMAGIKQVIDESIQSAQLRLEPHVARTILARRHAERKARKLGRSI